jgi:hypothetical protein
VPIAHFSPSSLSILTQLSVLPNAALVTPKPGTLFTPAFSFSMISNGSPVLVPHTPPLPPAARFTPAVRVTLLFIRGSTARVTLLFIRGSTAASTFDQMGLYLKRGPKALRRYLLFHSVLGVDETVEASVDGKSSNIRRTVLYTNDQASVLLVLFSSFINSP